MINITNTPPPEQIEINGKTYLIDYDFKTWAEIHTMIQGFVNNPQTKEDELNNYELILRMEQMVFGKLINQPWQHVLMAFAEFLKGYPKADNGYRNEGHDEPLYSFKYDMNYIVIAIRNQSGIDLSYRRKKPYHWWLFLLEFETLTEGHYIIELIQRRAYKGNDTDLLRLKRAAALPREITRADQQIIEEMDNLFYNT